MGLPTKLTHEEQALLNKFALLKKKKKTSSLKGTPVSLVEPNNAPVSPVKKDLPTNKSPLKDPPVNPKDAKEKAKQLLLSGQLKINKENANRSFKRAKGSVGERKTSKPSLTEEAFSSKDQTKKITQFRKDSYSNFVSGPKDGDSEQEQKPKNDFKPNADKTNLFVSGYGLTKQIMDTFFHHYGPIKNIYFDQDKGHGYVTYQKPEFAEKAIAELHGELKQGVSLKVVYARKRTYDDNRFTYRPRGARHDHDAGLETGSGGRERSAETIPRLATDTTKKSEIKQKRKPISYDDVDSFDF